jgi:N-methylhydantoinase A/oxoprolinase/acetone carboxylase beta subunit
LATGARADGPAVVEAYDSTTYVAPGWSLDVEGDLLVMQRAAP